MARNLELQKSCKTVKRRSFLLTRLLESNPGQKHRQGGETLVQALQFPRRYLRRDKAKHQKRISLETHRLLAHLTSTSVSYLPNQG